MSTSGFDVSCSFQMWRWVARQGSGVSYSEVCPKTLAWYGHRESRRTSVVVPPQMADLVPTIVSISAPVVLKDRSSLPVS